MLRPLSRVTAIVGFGALATLVVGFSAPVTFAAGTPEQECVNGRYAALAKYEACAQKAHGKFAVDNDGIKHFSTVGKCLKKYQATWAKIAAKASGTGSACDVARFTDNANGTVTDHLTALQWEMKTDDAGPHDKDNEYKWSVALSTASDGTLFTSFLSPLNDTPCFAGECDWRLPTLNELQTILTQFACSTAPGGCIDPIFGPTDPAFYWSATEDARELSSLTVWALSFGVGDYSTPAKAASNPVRAVRGGL